MGRGYQEPIIARPSFQNRIEQVRATAHVARVELACRHTSKSCFSDGKKNVAAARFWSSVRFKRAMVVKVADVAWASGEFMKKHGYSTPYAQSPEVCVEVRSPSNTQEEIEEKVALYLAAGAQEIWVVVEGNGITYYTHNRTMKKSKIFGRSESRGIGGRTNHKATREKRKTLAIQKASERKASG